MMQDARVEAGKKGRKSHELFKLRRYSTKKEQMARLSHGGGLSKSADSSEGV